MKIIIAIDHKNSSICKYIGESLSELKIILIRRQLLDYFIKMDIDNVVVNILDSIWLRHKCKTINFAISGFPDMLSYQPGETDLVKLIDINSHFIHSNILKIGFSVTKDDLNTVFNILANNIDKAGNKYTWILEPYFDNAISVNDRIKILAKLSTLDNLYSFKLDLEHPEIYNSLANDIFSEIPLYFRSDGLDFEDFIYRIKKINKVYFDGVIVGGAIWKDIIRSVYIENKVNEKSSFIISERLLKLKS